MIYNIVYNMCINIRRSQCEDFRYPLIVTQKIAQTAFVTYVRKLTRHTLDIALYKSCQFN